VKKETGFDALSFFISSIYISPARVHIVYVKKSVVFYYLLVFIKFIWSNLLKYIIIINSIELIIEMRGEV